jgi:cytochrome b561
VAIPVAAAAAPGERDRLAAARRTYILFYVIMLGLPLSGWALSSASMIIKVYPITLFHLVPWPTIDALASLPPDQMKSAHTVFVTIHGLLGKLTYALIVLHVGAASRVWFRF